MRELRLNINGKYVARRASQVSICAILKWHQRVMRMLIHMVIFRILTPFRSASILHIADCKHFIIFKQTYYLMKLYSYNVILMLFHIIAGGGCFVATIPLIGSRFGRLARCLSH